MCVVCLGVTSAVTALSGIFGAEPAVNVEPVRIALAAEATKQSKFAGKSCKTAGTTQTVSSVTFICKARGKNLKWVQVRSSDQKKNQPTDVKPAVTPKTATVAPTSGADVAACKLPNASGRGEIVTGFPISGVRLPRQGTINAHVIFVDFPDYPAVSGATSPEAFFQARLLGTDDYFKTLSRGKTSFDWKVTPFYVRLPKTAVDYNLTRGGQPISVMIQDAINLLDPRWDFTGAQMIVVVTNPAVPEQVMGVSPAAPMPANSPFTTNEGLIYNGTVQAGDSHRLGWPILSHEIGHLFGLMDHYSFQWRPGEPYENIFQHIGRFDLMSGANGPSPELIGWNRWLLQWVDDSQVYCVVDQPDTNLLVKPINSSEGTRLGVIRLSETRAVAFESKRYDAKYCSNCQSGVLVYQVDTTKQSGFGPLQVVRKAGSVQPWFEDSLLKPGEFVSVDGWTITNVESGDFGDVLNIKKAA
jgi:M6 family metalloprotease-like protein